MKGGRVNTCCASNAGRCGYKGRTSYLIMAALRLAALASAAAPGSPSSTARRNSLLRFAAIALTCSLSWLMAMVSYRGGKRARGEARIEEEEEEEEEEKRFVSGPSTLYGDGNASRSLVKYSLAALPRCSVMAPNSLPSI